MSTKRHHLEWIANTVSILAALALCATLGQQYLRSQASGGASPLAAGTTVNLNDVKWRDQESTVLLALSVGCSYCSASAPFYRELLAAAATRSVQVIAVLPQAPTEAGVYLEHLDLEIPYVRQADLGQLGLSGTPTLLIVDRDGKVRSGWVGKLSESQETEVFDALKLRRLPQAAYGTVKTTASATQATEARGIGPAQLLALSRDLQTTVVVVDIRERDMFERGHVAGAVNIPLSELEVRASHELPADGQVAVYCRFSSKCEGAVADAGGVTYCALAEKLLKDAGLKNVRPLVGDLQTLQAVGIPITGESRERS